MRIPKIYLETTIFNFYFEPDRDLYADTRRLFNAISLGEYKTYTSTYVTDELMKADEPKRTQMLMLISEFDIIVLRQA